MRLRSFTLILLLVLLVAFTACQQAGEPAARTFADEKAKVADAKTRVTSITSAELKDKIEKEAGAFVLIDARTCQEVNDGMIPGAKWIPRGKLEFAIAKEVPGKDTEIITYCKKGSRAALAADALRELGYTNVKYQDGGWDAWIKAYPDMVEIKLAKYEAPGDMVAAAKKRVHHMTPEELHKMIEEKQDFVLIDIRDEFETKKGMIPGATRLSRGRLEFRIMEDFKLAEKQGKDTKIVLYCKKGSRAALSTESLGELGYTDVTFVDGGWEKWHELYPKMMDKPK